MSTFYWDDLELVIALNECEELGFDDLPHHIQEELRSRGIMWPSRQPTEKEMKEAEQDAIEHRIMNREMTIDDHYDMLKGRMRHIHVR